MYSQNNYRYTNQQPKGTVADFFDYFSNLIDKNDGTRSFIYRTTDCYNSDAPFDMSQESRIMITAPDFDITNISDSYITMKVNLKLQLNKALPDMVDPDKLMKVFVGWRCSNQILDQLQIVSNNNNTGYQQNECVREGFAYATLMDKHNRTNRKYVQTLYKQANEYNTNVCGTFVDLVDLADGAVHSVDFDITLPIDHILAFQAFDLWPNKIGGSIELKFYVKPKGLVYCMVDPECVLFDKKMKGLDVKADGFTPDVKTQYLHQFTQIHNPAKIITKAKLKDGGEGDNAIHLYEIAGETVRLDCTAMTITQCKCTTANFNVVQSTRDHIKEIFSKGFCIPTQKLEYNAFPLAIANSNLQTTTNMPLHNCTCISIMFPRRDNDFTVFENPFLENLQLTVAGKNLPDEPTSTIGNRFLQDQLLASDLDGPSEPTKEHVASLTLLKNDDKDANHTRLKNVLTDQTSFMWNVQLERHGSGYAFDGFDSYGQNIPIQITASPIYRTTYTKDGKQITNGNNTYYYPDIDDETIHPPPPQIWTCSDTYFLATLNGITYVNDTPPNSQVEA